jgi:hypothetical protein
MAAENGINGLPPEAVSYSLVCRVVCEATVGCGRDSVTVADPPDVLAEKGWRCLLRGPDNDDRRDALSGAVDVDDVVGRR